MDGFYPGRSKRASDGFEPSSALVKAVLINGAVAMQGVTANGLPIEPAPSCRQGFGRMHLSQSLPLQPYQPQGGGGGEGASAPAPNMYVSDGALGALYSGMTSFLNGPQTRKP